MEITWTGTAGFIIKTRSCQFLIDPYLTRNQEARPVQTMKHSDVRDVSHIFISHGHFDHIFDVAKIASLEPSDFTGLSGSRANVYCSEKSCAWLEKQGLDPDQVTRVVNNGWKKQFANFTAQAFFSSHARFDLKLMIRTLLKINFRFFQCAKLFSDYPCGQVLSWRFFLDNRIIQFFGSAGADARQLSALKSLEPIDILLIPLQGHSDICRIAAEYVQTLRPRVVIPHHYDDFYPPISQYVDPAPFVEQVTAECLDTKIIIPGMNIPIQL